MLILDTFNVLHTVGVLPPELAGLDVPGLAMLIQRSRYASEKVVFACDGLPASDMPAPGPLELPEHPDAAIDVRYSGRAATADDDIRTMIDASSSPRRLTVVSTDHEISRHARKRRCTALTSEEFLQHLADDANLPRATGVTPRRPSMMSEEQVRKWIDVFAVDEESLRELAMQMPTPGEDESDEDADDTVLIKPDTDGDSSGLDHREPIAISELPPDLILEAEAMWQREARKAPPPTTPKTSTAPAAQPSPEDEPIDPLDMNAILPNDGRTMPLRKRDNKHRPS